MDETEEGIGSFDYNTGFEIGYLSGAIDGEGSIAISKVKRNRGKKWWREPNPEYFLRVYVTCTDMSFLERLKGICVNTGYIRPHNKKGVTGSSGVTARKDSYRYWLSNELFKDFVPYLNLTVKKEQLKIAMQFLELVEVGRHHSTYSYTEEKIAELEELYLKMKELNRR